MNKNINKDLTLEEKKHLAINILLNNHQDDLQKKIGFDLRTGDFLAMDVHEWHCNTEMRESPSDKKFNKEIPEIYRNNKETGTQGVDKLYSRLSFVCYLRENLIKCNATDSKPYYKRIGYDPKSETLTPVSRKGKATRKKRRVYE